VSETQVIGILVGLNVIQFLGWGYQVHTLINKLMCKNLAEYELVKNGPPKVEPKEEPRDGLMDEQDILNELNGMFKGVS
jgi:hypothetical protein